MALMPRAGHSYELPFLVAAARAFLADEPLGEVPALPAHAPDWERVLKRAEEERLAALLYAVFSAYSPPIPILDRLRTAWVAAQRQHLLGVEQLQGLLDAFEREGVPVVLLKRPALAEALYRDPALRPFTDLDLLIPRADLGRALRLLSEMGYRHLADERPFEFELGYAGAACFVSARGRPFEFPLDLHWELLTHPGGVPARGIDRREVWGRAVKGQWGNRPTRVLCPEDLLIYLALHWAVHHAFAGLIWQLDLALLLRRHGATLDWEAVGERARGWRIRGALYFALRMVQERLGVPVPVPLLSDLRPRGVRASAVAWLLRRRDERRGRLDHAIPLLLMDRGSDFVRALACGALPLPGWACLRYGKGSLLGAYLAHYARLGSVALRTLRAASRSPSP